MKKILVVLFAISSATAMANQAVNLSNLPAGDQTPYQKMEALYNQALPMQLGQFPTAASVKSWNCTGASPATKDSDLQNLNLVPAHVVAKVVIAPANPGTPSSGPLFPGTPATLEQDALMDMIFFLANDGSSSETPEALGVEYSGSHIQLTSSPGVTESYEAIAGDITTEATASYRMINGLIVCKQDSINAAIESSQFGYFYCWQQ